MASITGKPNLFFITSPRSPYKMKDEIKVLVENFSGQRWSGNPDLQRLYYRTLAETPFFYGSKNGDLALKARDRITRGPKALGLVDIEPNVALTPAGYNYIYESFSDEAFTRQLLKFQLPSPFHVDRKGTFFVKPYLELFRLIDDLGELSKDEIAAFAMQLIHLDKYEEIMNKIIEFRNVEKFIDRSKSNYDRFFDDQFTQEIMQTYKENIESGDYSIRQSGTNTIDDFVKTKKSNHLDYADAAIRYLRETKLFSIKGFRSTKIRIDENKKEEIKFLVASVSREPELFTSEDDYKKYLFNDEVPVLLSDDRDYLINSLINEYPVFTLQELEKSGTLDLKILRSAKNEERLIKLLKKQEDELKTYDSYASIVEVFDSIQSHSTFDPSLFMEWNTWRALVMLDDGTITGNFTLDDTGMPLANAPGNKSDIVCNYNDFDLTVEVTLSSGVTQYVMEGEPVPRHLGNLQKESPKSCYGLFIAPHINEATLSHFFVLHRTNVSYYGGIARIIPLALDDFKRMIELAYTNETKPDSRNIGYFTDKASVLALSSNDEHEWYEGIRGLIETWV